MPPPLGIFWSGLSSIPNDGVSLKLNNLLQTRTNKKVTHPSSTKNAATSGPAVTDISSQQIKANIALARLRAMRFRNLGRDESGPTTPA